MEHGKLKRQEDVQERPMILLSVLEDGRFNIAVDGGHRSDWAEGSKYTVGRERQKVEVNQDWGRGVG